MIRFISLSKPSIFGTGVILGSGIAILLLGLRPDEPVISFHGKVHMDSASYADSRLNNAIYIENPTIAGSRIRLRFSDDKSMNASLGKQVQVTGPLKALKLENGDVITELLVSDLQIKQ